MSEFETGYVPNEKPTYPNEVKDYEVEVSANPELETLLAKIPKDAKLTLRAELLAELMHKEPDTPEATNNMLTNLAQTYEEVQRNSFAANTPQHRAPNSPSIQNVLMRKLETRMKELCKSEDAGEGLRQHVEQLLSQTEQEQEQD